MAYRNVNEKRTYNYKKVLKKNTFMLEIHKKYWFESDYL